MADFSKIDGFQKIETINGRLAINACSNLQSITGFKFDKLEYRCRGTGDQSKNGFELFEGYIIVDRD